MKYIKLFENFKTLTNEEVDNFFIKMNCRIGFYLINNNVIDVEGDVDISRSFLSEIPFKFGKVTGNFNCHYNKLTTLNNAPYFVGGDFVCSFNKLINLVGSPIDVEGDFKCSSNENLKSLEGMPSEISGDFYCHSCPKLKELDSVSNIGGDIICDNMIDSTKFDGDCRNRDYIMELKK
jgi:hypothetical protein